MSGQRVGYKRVSSVDQNTERQLDGQQLDKVFIDQASGKSTDRPELIKLIEHVREGDVVVVHSMDRLARNLDDLRKLVKRLTDRKVTVEFLKEGLKFTGEDTPVANLMLSIMGAVAEFERSLILERQREGIELAKARGEYKGRKPSLSEQQVKELKERAGKGENKAALARELKISRATLYEYLKPLPTH